MRERNNYIQPSVIEDGVAVSLVSDWASFSTTPRDEAAKGPHTRTEIIAMGASSHPINRAQLFQVILYDTNENNRESALKALASHGTEPVLSFLEAVWHSNEPARFGKQAVQNALSLLGLLRDDAPLLNPFTLHESFVNLVACSSSNRVPTLGRPDTCKAQSLALVDYIPWTPAHSSRIHLSLNEEFDTNVAIRRAERAGLDVRRFGDSLLAVEGNRWPGTDHLHVPPHISLVFCIQPDHESSSLGVVSYPIPEDSGVSSWREAVCFLVRLTRWLGQKERESSSPFPARGSSQEIETGGDEDTAWGLDDFLESTDPNPFDSKPGAE